MKLIQLSPTVFYNADYIYSIIEAPWLGNKKQITLQIGNWSVVLRMNAATFINELYSGKQVIDVSPYVLE